MTDTAHIDAKRINAGPMQFVENGRLEPLITLRDHFAMAALTGIIVGDVEDNLKWDQISDWSYKAADAMIAERNKQTDNDK